MIESITAKKCPVCGSRLITGSGRFAVITPSDPRESEPAYEERFYISIYYCPKSDSHLFGLLRRA